MAEGDVNYASVVFKSDQPRNTTSAAAAANDDTVYDEVKVKSEASQRSADAHGRERCLWPVGCLAIACVLLLLGLVGVAIYLATISDEITKMNQLRENLLADKQDLRNVSEQLNKELNSLKLQLENMTQNYNVSEGKNTKLENVIQELKENFTKQITDLEDNWEKFNVSRAQWTIDSYCPADTSKVRKCSACLKGWDQIQKSCIVLHNSEAPSELKTWEEARENCRGRDADLVVVHDEEEKNVIDAKITHIPVSQGYWMGLRVEGGTWKWIDGTDLMNASWIERPAEGHCAVSLGNKGWTSVKCDEKRTRICSKKALSV
uniref:C-type lectin domain family 10 member A-like isoform X2 n=1 Tax=Gasterosteus aculeatus aculeatus TaxID=481459 RepID=UPI001A9839C7|nr:C-type lectin domain family 10 member A-like isoform X2 [Gasterosteus aculeatus aculeatus]